MVVIFYALVQTAIIFLAFRFVMIAINKMIEKKWGKASEDKLSNLLRSMAFLLIAVTMWLLIVANLTRIEGTMSTLQFYISMVMIGVSGVIWCYFSWDEDRFLSKPREATRNEKKSKKIVLYSLLCIFVLVLGYQQTINVFEEVHNVPTLYTTTNNSVVVAIIAFDRIMNQIFTKDN